MSEIATKDNTLNGCSFSHLDILNGANAKLYIQCGLEMDV